MQIDIVTVAHNTTYMAMSYDLEHAIESKNPDNTFSFYIHDNREDNVGFAKGCNIAAAMGSSPIIGFINPDAKIDGPFIDKVVTILGSGVDVTGCRFNKPASHLKEWGVHNWVCGATFFVKRSHFEKLGGFDERFVWSFEETDFIRRTEAMGGVVMSAALPIAHSSPESDTLEDKAYKEQHFAEAQKLYKEKWS